MLIAQFESDLIEAVAILAFALITGIGHMLRKKQDDKTTGKSVDKKRSEPATQRPTQVRPAQSRPARSARPVTRTRPPAPKRPSIERSGTAPQPVGPPVIIVREEAPRRKSLPAPQQRPRRKQAPKHRGPADRPMPGKMARPAKQPEQTRTTTASITALPHPMTPEAMRQAIILSEILKPPLALREFDE